MNEQAGRSEGVEAARLLGESVAAYREALTVYTEEHSPYDHGVVTRSLQQVETQLNKLGGNTP